MRTILFGLLAVALTGCEPTEQDRPDENLETSEPPLFAIDYSATGPLTLDELQIDLENSTIAKLTEEQQICFLNRIEVLAAEAGDPQSLNPESIKYLHPKEQWHLVSDKARRALLAQAIVPHAFAFCLYQ